MTKDLVTPKPCATIIEYKDLDEKDNYIRIYCLQWPDTFSFQIRVYGSTNEFGKGKKRHMVATVTLNQSDIENILNYLKAQK